MLPVPSLLLEVLVTFSRGQWCVAMIVAGSESAVPSRLLIIMDINPIRRQDCAVAVDKLTCETQF